MMTTTRAETLLAAAREEHARGVTDDTAGAPHIDHYIRDGLEWGWRRKYKPQRFEWCGAFAAYCYMIAGLSRAVRRKHMASCYRLWKWSGEGKPNDLRISKHELQPGDIAVCGPAGHRWGRHIVLVINVSQSLVHTFEGNATGQLKSGVIGEGVIRNTRPLHSSDDREYRILYGVRPTEACYDADS